MPTKEKILLLEKHHKKLSLTRQCRLLEVARSTAYYLSKHNARDESIMREIDAIFTRRPFYGSRRMCFELKNQGYVIGRKHTATLMEDMGIKAIYPKKKTSIANKDHKVYPYLLKGIKIYRPNQVWSTDITYIRLSQGFIYLVAVIDWFSRYVLSWQISISMEKEFCIEALENALTINTPSIFNSDQGSQFTSPDFTKRLTDKEIKISMDGKGRCYDNIFVERLWRTVKYEEVYIKQYTSPMDAYQGLKEYFYFYNHQRPHQAHNYLTPAQIYFQSV